MSFSRSLFLKKFMFLWLLLIFNFLLKVGWNISRERLGFMIQRIGFTILQQATVILCSSFTLGHKSGALCLEMAKLAFLLRNISFLESSLKNTNLLNLVRTHTNSQAMQIRAALNCSWQIRGTVSSSLYSPKGTQS